MGFESIMADEHVPVSESLRQQVTGHIMATDQEADKGTRREWAKAHPVQESTSASHASYAKWSAIPIIFLNCSTSWGRGKWANTEACGNPLPHYSSVSSRRFGLGRKGRDAGLFWAPPQQPEQLVSSLFPAASLRTLFPSPS